MIRKLLLTTEMIWIKSRKILKNKTQKKNRKKLIAFDDMIADILSSERLNLIVTELFIRSRKLNISLVFITQSYFEIPKMLD